MAIPLNTNQAGLTNDTTTFNGGLTSPVPGFSFSPPPLQTDSPGLDYGGNTDLQGENITAPAWTDPTGQGLTQAQYNDLTGSFNTQKSNIYGSANDWANNYGVGLGGSITDYVNNLHQGQQGIDERGVQNELALKQGRASILDMVARGIRSGGVMLSNRNASDSSASAALANAYGDLGRRQLSSVGNQHAIEDRNIGIAQEQFNTNAQSGARKIKNTETMDIAGAVAQARNSLAALDAWAVDKSLPQRIQVEQEKAAIQGQIENALSKYGGQLDSGVAGVQPTSLESRRSTAAGLVGQGVEAASPFNFTDQVPAQFQNSSSPGQLPIYTTPRKKTA